MLGAGLESIKRKVPDIIIGWYFEPYGVAASLLGRMYNVPVVLRHAGSDLGRLRNVSTLGIAYDAFLSEAAAVITGKSAQTETILKQAGVRDDAVFRAKGRALHRSFCDPSQVFDLPELVARSEEWFSNYGFDDDTYQKLIAWNRAGLESDDPAIGSYGKIAEVKGTYNLIDAIDALASKGIKVSYRALWSATPKRFAHAFKYLSERQNMRGRSIVLPPVAPWRVPGFIRSCSAVAFLENRFPITFHTPQVPREVIACGSPLILSGEIYEKVYFGSQLVDRVNVLKIDDPQDVAQLEKGIADLIASSELRQCLIHHSKALSRVLEARAPLEILSLKLLKDWLAMNIAQRPSASLSGFDESPGQVDQKAAAKALLRSIVALQSSRTIFVFLFLSIVLSFLASVLLAISPVLFQKPLTRSRRKAR